MDTEGGRNETRRGRERRENEGVRGREKGSEGESVSVGGVKTKKGVKERQEEG